MGEDGVEGAVYHVVIVVVAVTVTTPPQEPGARGRGDGGSGSAGAGARVGVGAGARSAVRWCARTGRWSALGVAWSGERGGYDDRWRGDRVAGWAAVWGRGCGS